MTAKGKQSTPNYGATSNTAPIPELSNPTPHMQTYTAGEDGSRLASMAREFGLQHQRRPRTQIRERVNVPLNSLRGFFYERILDPQFANVRMRSVYTSRDDDVDVGLGEEEGVEAVMRRPFSWKEDDFGGVFADEEIVDPHAEGLGGDLSAAVLGIIKGMVGR
jgi:hypothetical protein